MSNLDKYKMEMKSHASMQPLVLRISDAMGTNDRLLSGLPTILAYKPGSVYCTHKHKIRPSSPISEWLVDDIILQTEGFTEIADSLLRHE